MLNKSQNAENIGVPYGVEPRVAAVKGRCPNATRTTGRNGEIAPVENEEYVNVSQK